MMIKLLKDYDIEIEDLYRSRPKHLLSQKHIHHMIALLLKNNEIVSLIIDKGTLPMSKILKQYKTTKKRIEPYRQYIIAMILICSGQFELLKDYMPSEVMKG